jgi:hypothetical protein
VKNNGPGTAGAVTIADDLPGSVNYGSATPSAGSCGESSGTVTCQLGTLASGDSASVRIKVIPQAAGTITNVASVTSNEDDATLADNIAREDTTVIARYPRPKGATPLRVSLVPTFRPCTSPNSVHGAPLAFGSCKPPAQQSSHVTVGTPDANGKGANSLGFVTLEAQSGDVRETVSISDVRNHGNLTDYTGDLRESAIVRITDRDNGPGDDQATVQDTPFGATVSCGATADTTVGATCSLTTTYNALAPGSVVAGARAIWQLGQVQLLDAVNVPFAVQGVFAP